MDENDYLDPTSVSKTLIDKQSGNQTSTSILITSIVLTALIGGFGFAVAYILLYILYDWITQPTLVVDIMKLVISIFILIGLLTILVIASYYIIKRSMHTEPQYSVNSSIKGTRKESEDPNIRPTPRKR
jgi:flagellar biosynthesis protein FlhB